MEECKRYAEENGFRLNPEKKIVEGNVKRLLENEKREGERYCPCRRTTGDREKDKKIICPCAYHREEIRRQGYCHCMLFVK